MIAPATPLRCTRRLALGLAVASTLGGCRDAGKASEQRAFDEVTRLLPIVKENVEQVRRGLPDGAKKLATLIDPDPGANLAGLQRAIKSSRASVKDLDLAKSTFFSFADTAGVVLRSEADPDAAANHSILAPFPALKGALDPASGVVEAFGSMDELRGFRTGDDAQWVLAHPVVDGERALKGLFVTGWSFRRYAQFLEDAAKRHLTDAAEKDGKTAIPVIYVLTAKGDKAYGAPLTPEVNVEAIDEVGLVAKTADGPYRAVLEITGRTFGLAAARTPELGEDTAVAVIISEL